MKGDLAYEQNIQRRIDNLLEENNMLIGYYTFISDNAITTVFRYLLYVNTFIKYTDFKKSSDLTIDDFSGYMLKIQKNKDGSKSTSSYRIAVYSALKKYGKYLVASEQLKNNPMDYIKRPKAIDSKETIEKRDKGYLSKKEIQQYIQNVKTGVGSNKSKKIQADLRERDLAIILILLNTGIRCSALLKMDLDSIDFEKKTLTVTDKESLVNKYDLTDELLEVIKNWMVKREEMLDGKEEEALFISKNRTRLTETPVRELTKKYAAEFKGKSISPHKLRATYGTQLYDATKDIYFVQQCMNHGSPKTTELYVRGNKNQTKKASDIMGKLTIK